MSELSPIGTINSDYNMKSGSVGPLISSTLGKILDENGKSLPANTPGELALHGPQVMMGYMDEPDKTKECLSDSGWLRTGDVAHYDEDGFVSSYMHAHACMYLCWSGLGQLRVSRLYVV